MPKVPSNGAKTFQAVLQRSGGELNWVTVAIPFDAAKLWGKRGQLRVKGEINGFPFRTSLFPTGQGSHYLLVNKKMQAGGKAAPGIKAKFLLEPDTAPREEAQMPDELRRMLRQSKPLQKYFDSLGQYNRRWIGTWVSQGKQSETRQRRAEQIAERLFAAMEGERELPPILRAAFQQNPRARQGWDLMPPSHRRSHLLGIFYYRDPESRARRVAKAVEDMVAYAERREEKRGGTSLV